LFKLNIVRTIFKLNAVHRGEGVRPARAAQRLNVKVGTALLLQAARVRLSARPCGNDRIVRSWPAGMLSGDVVEMARLLDAGAEPDALVAARATESIGHGAVVQRTALAAAATGGQLDAVRLLLDRGADPSLADSLGLTPLMCAAMNGHAAVVRELAARGADLEAVDPATSVTAFFFACRSGYIRLSLRSTAQPLYTRFPIIFGRCFSKVTLGYYPTLLTDRYPLTIVQYIWLNHCISHLAIVIASCKKLIDTSVLEK
jgi:hypothetical protein